MVSAEVNSGGELSFEGQIVGRLQGFRFTPDANFDAERAAIDNAAVASAIVQEFEVRANRFSEAVDSALVLANDGAIRWLGDPVAKIVAGDKLFAPRALILADESLTEAARQKLQDRIDLWLAAYVRRLLGPLFELEAAVGLEGAARNVALQLAEAQGVLERGRVAHDVKSLDQNARGTLRKLGVRFGAYYIYIPALVKPAIRVLATQLWALGQTGAGLGAGLDEIPQLAASGRTSFVADSAIPRETYRVAGFRLCGERAVRVDIVERLADLIRPAVAYRPGPNAGPPPAGAADGDGFVVTGAMTSLTGCSGEQFASVLRSLGFSNHSIKGPALTLVAPAAPATPSASAQDGEPVGAAEAMPDASESQIASLSVEQDSQSVTQQVSQPVETTAAAATESTAPASQIADGPPEGDARTAPDLASPPSHALANEAASAVAAESPDAAEGPVVDEESETASQAAATDVLAGVESSAAGSDPAAAPVEEALIEVWRPRPPPNRRRNPRPASREGASARPHAPAEGDERPDRREGPPSERTKHRRHRHFQAPAPQAAPDGESSPQRSEQEANRPSHGRGPRRRFEPPNKSDGDTGRWRGPNRGGGKDQRKQDERRQDDAPAPAARREPPIDLNSPFAKLLALKSQLEAKGKS